MSADYKVQRLYDEFIRDVTKSADNWKNFLRITGRIYRYEFDNILMVYAQRPNATLVGDYDSWKKVGRYVKRGSRGIAIFPSKILKPHMRYVFDISDTAGKNVKLTWDLNSDNLKSLVDELASEKKIEPYTDSGRNNLMNLLKNYTKSNIRSIMKEESEIRISELNRITGGVIKGGDNETQGLTAEEMLHKSILYAVGTRCGFALSSEEQDMGFITNISDEDDIYRFGSLVCDVSCSVLKMMYPNLEMPQEKVSMTQVGRYGMMAAEYLKENERMRYNTLYRLGRLAEKMKEVDTEANSLMDKLMKDYLKKHKLENPFSTMEMWKIREQEKMMAEEVVLHQVVYRFH